jgi:hypothetical protein
MHGGKRLTRLGTVRNRTALWSITLIATGVGGAGASAQEWQLSSNLQQQVFYSDNLLLSRDQETSSFGLLTAPTLHLERNSPAGTIAFDGRFEFAEYIDHSEFNSQDQFLRFNVDQAITERSGLRFSANFTHDTTLKSEQDVTGRFLDQSFDFINWNVGPGWVYALTPIDQIGVRGYYQNVNYDTNEKTDYQYFGPSFDYTRQLDELTKITGTLSWYRYIPDEPGTDYTDTYGSLLSYTYTPSETFTISGGVGLAYSTRHQDPGKDSDDIGYRLKFNTKYLISDQTSLVAGFSHDTEPSGDGDQVVRNRANVGLSYKFTPLTTAALNVDYADNVDFLGFEGDSTTDESRSRYTSVRPSLSYQLTEDWSIKGEYRFRYRLFEDESGDATSNSVYVTLQYNFPTLGWTED